jgi:hypothetical protein
MPKYNDMMKVLNDSELYRKYLEDRGANKGIIQYRTKIFGKDILDGISTTDHIWSMGDMFYRLSYKYYGSYKFWWVIALYNAAPTEAHLEYGDVIKIPNNPRAIAGRA